MAYVYDPRTSWLPATLNLAFIPGARLGNLCLVPTVAASLMYVTDAFRGGGAVNRSPGGSGGERPFAGRIDTHDS